MNVLQRITTQYSPGEDRLRLAGEVAPGQVQVLWLTQRLLGRVVPHLLQWLEQTTPGSVQGGQTGYHVDAVQGFAQQAARAQLRLQPPVLSRSDSRQWLVGTVDVTAGPHNMALLFKGTAAPEQAQLSLSPQALHQWLGILHDQYRAAHWPMLLWPEWMTQSAPTNAPKALLH